MLSETVAAAARLFVHFLLFTPEMKDLVTAAAAAKKRSVLGLLAFFRSSGARRVFRVKKSLAECDFLNEAPSFVTATLAQLQLTQSLHSVRRKESRPAHKW